MKKYLLLLFIFASCVPPKVVRERRSIPARVEDEIVATPDSLIQQPEFIERETAFRLRQRSAVIDTAWIIIPTVIHIIHGGETAASNISDEQVKAAFQILNEQFSATGIKGQPKIPNKQGQWIVSDTCVNGDTRLNSFIKFVPITTMPDGSPTNGIIRVNGAAKSPEYSLNGIRRLGTTLGALDATVKSWSYVKDVMNVWVVTEISGNNAGSGVVAYASLPMTVGESIDGVVVQYTAFGTRTYFPGSTNNTSLENTFTHEVGHYCGLYHTFNNTTACTVETNPLVQGDKVADTAPMKNLSTCDYHFHCFPNSPFSNFWSYSAHTMCMNIYNRGMTQGQIDRMRFQLKNYRTSVINNTASYTAPVQLDAAIEFTGSTTTCSASMSSIQVKVSNIGQSAISKVVINSNEYTVNITKGSSQIVTLKDIVPLNFGSNSYVITLWKVNGSADLHTGNNTTTPVFNRIQGQICTMNFWTDYYAGETSWKITDNTGATVAVSPRYTTGTLSPKKITTEFCLAPGTYTLTLEDGNGDATTTGMTRVRPGFELITGGTVIKSVAACWCQELATTQAQCKASGCRTFSINFTIE